MTFKAQTAYQLLASIAIATFMFTILSSYVSSQRLMLKSEFSEIPLTLRHMKADIDSDFSTLFCDAGLCINSVHQNDALLTFNLNHHSGLFANISNYTGGYTVRFNSSRKNFSLMDLLSKLDSSYLLLGEAATDSNCSFTQLLNKDLIFNFNSSGATAYYMHYSCVNTTSIDWTPEPDSTGDLNLTFSVIGYTKKPILLTKINSIPPADGHIGYNEIDFIVDSSSQTSSIGFDYTEEILPDNIWYRSYLSFDSSLLPDDATIVRADIFVTIDSYDTIDYDPEWNVEYRIASDIIGNELNKEDWNNEKFVPIGTVDYSSLGDIKIEIPSEYLSSINLMGSTDFELVPTWGEDAKIGQKALVHIRQTEYESDTPILSVEYLSGPCKIYRSLNYSTKFNTTCGPINVSIIRGNVYTNFSYLNFSFNATLPTNNSIGVFPLKNLKVIKTSWTSFSSICSSGTEPNYPSSVSTKLYGEITEYSPPIRFIIANNSGYYNTLYFDTNGNCNFTDFNDEYFVTISEWIKLGPDIGRLYSIAPDGSGATIEFASAGIEETILKARLVQPIYLNK